MTHDRYFSTMSGWIPNSIAVPVPGRHYSSWLEQKQKRLQLEEKSESMRQRTLARELNGCAGPRPARQKQGALKRTTSCWARTREADRESRNLNPAGPDWGTSLSSEGSAEAYGDSCSSTIALHATRGGIVGVIGQNGAGKTTRSA